MRILMITTGYLPYTFSENLCNGKLGYALQRFGWEMDVISRSDEGPTYSAEWVEPWTAIRDGVHEIKYSVGNKLIKGFDTLWSSFKLGVHPEAGIRWARRAYELALKLCRERHYDAILTRSPTDISHLVGLRLKQKLNIKLIANWNDPASPIWPEPYKHHFSSREQERRMRHTKMCLEGADVNTFPSQSLLDHFTKHFSFLSSSRTAVIPHIALMEEIMPEAPHTAQTDKFRLCHSGNLSKERNPELTFKALRELIDEGGDKIEFAIMGKINDYTSELINKYRLEEYVKCIGSFPYMEALQKMMEFDCLVLLEAKLEKGVFFASKFTDYAQIGKPILAISPVDGFAVDTISKYGGGICVDNEDATSIKQGIAELYSAWQNGTLASNYSTATLYDQFKAEKVVDIYQNLLGQ